MTKDEAPASPKDAALKLALEALEEARTNDDSCEKWDRNKEAITAIKEALAQPEQEPTCPECKAAVLYECVACSSNNYPPKPVQEPLTDEQIKQALISVDHETKRLPPGMKAFARAVEAAHNIGAKP
jgi:hypothetical protein